MVSLRPVLTRTWVGSGQDPTFLLHVGLHPWLVGPGQADRWGQFCHSSINLIIRLNKIGPNLGTSQKKKNRAWIRPAFFSEKGKTKIKL